MGAVLCVLGTPPAGGCDGVTTEFSASDFEELLLKPSGLAWFLILVLVVLGSVTAILWYERRYPSTPKEPEASPPELQQAEGNKCPTDTDSESISETVVHDAKPVSQVWADDEQREASAVNTSSSISRASSSTSLGGKRAWLHLVMSVIYPASLGLDEGVADLLIKGWSAMLSVCTSTGKGCSSLILWISIVFWVISAFASAFWWMPKVFGRYEVTMALPVEYGALNFANVCTGLLFYAEYKSMTGDQLALVIAGCAVILSGIAVGQLRLN